MEYQTTLLLLLLCSHVCHFPEVNVPSTVWNSSIIINSGQVYKYGHFVKSSSSYYSNSTATFNYRLLLAGDIQTNPGPVPIVQKSYIQNDDLNATTLI